MSLKRYVKKMQNYYIVNKVIKTNIPSFDPSTIIRMKLVFSGKVQRVGFRHEMHELAKRLDLTGWVKNRSDEKVEAEVQGEYDKILYLIEHMKSLKRAIIDNVEAEKMHLLDNEMEFLIIRDI